MSRTLAIIVIFSLAAPLARAAPDQLCVPEVGTNEPAWSNPGLSASKKEARWSGALVRKLVSGTRSVRARALWSSSSEVVYFEYGVAGDPTLDPTSDVLLLALGDEAGTSPELFVRIAPLAGCPAGACGGAGAAVDALDVSYASASPGVTSLTWGPLSDVNPSASFAVDDPWVVVTQGAAAVSWTLSFALVVPVDAAGEIRSNLKIYGNAIAHETGLTSGTDVELPVLCTSSSLTSNDCLALGGPSPELPADLPYPNMDDTWSVLRSDCPLLVVH